MRRLVTGASGMLGSEICRQLNNDCFRTDLRVAGRTGIKPFDLTQKEHVAQLFAESKPNIVFHTAAFTDVDRCESESKIAFEVNTHSVASLAQEAKKYGALFILISTDYVFDGQKQGAYATDDAVQPRSVYGKSKALAEQAVRESGAKYLIVRTSWLYGERGKNFVDTILRLASEKTEISVVTDQCGALTYTGDLASALISLADWALKESVSKPDFQGEILHCTNRGRASWFDVASMICDYAKLNCQVKPISSKEFVRPAERPKNSSLQIEATEALIGRKMPEWEDSLKAYLSRNIKDFQSPIGN